MTTALLPRPQTLARLVEMRARVAVDVRALESDQPTPIEGTLVAASEAGVTLHLPGVGDIEIPSSALCAFRALAALPSSTDVDVPTPPPC